MSGQNDLNLALKETSKWARKAGTLEGVIDSVIWRLRYAPFDDDKAKDLSVELSDILAEIKKC